MECALSPEGDFAISWRASFNIVLTDLTNNITASVGSVSERSSKSENERNSAHRRGALPERGAPRCV